MAIDGTYVDEDKSFQLMEGITLNEKFTEDPKKYFQEKLMNAIFRKVLSKISRKLDVVANMHAGKYQITNHYWIDNVHLKKIHQLPHQMVELSKK